MSLSVLTADTTNNPHKKPPPYFFCAALQLLITPPHRATANQVRDPFFFACEGESHLYPAPTPHAGGASSGQTVPGPFHLGTPPLSLGRFMSRGSQKLSPRFNYYSTNLYSREKVRPALRKQRRTRENVEKAPGALSKSCRSS